MNQVKNQNTNNAKKKEFTIKIDETREFPGVQKSEITTLVDIGKMVNSIFRPVFSDYAGCNLTLAANNSIVTELYFKYTGQSDPDKYTAVARKSDMARTSNNPMQMINNLNNRNSSKQFVLTQPAMDIISEFLYGSVSQNGNINWEKDKYGIVTERTQRANQMYNSYVSYVQINHIDINKIIRAIYGKRDGDTKFEYSILPIRELPSVDGRLRNMLVSITQVNVKEVETLLSKLGGYTPTKDSIPMIV